MAPPAPYRQPSSPSRFAPLVLGILFWHGLVVVLYVAVVVFLAAYRRPIPCEQPGGDCSFFAPHEAAGFYGLLVGVPMVTVSLLASFGVAAFVARGSRAPVSRARAASDGLVITLCCLVPVWAVPTLIALSTG